MQLYFRRTMILFQKLCMVSALLLLSQIAIAHSEQVEPLAKENKDFEGGEVYKAWLRKQFAEQHQKLTPIVAVADMFHACNQVRNASGEQYTVKFLVEEMDKDLLASKLENCLAEDNLNSDAAVNFGLMGCFQEQLSKLPDEEKKAKMKLVRQAINSLDRVERQGTLTQCVTDQAISYLK